MAKKPHNDSHDEDAYDAADEGEVVVDPAESERLFQEEVRKAVEAGLSDG